MSQHRSVYGKWEKGNYDKITSYDIFDKYDIENCSIVLIEEINCESKDQLLAKERFWIEQLKCVNKCLPCISNDEKLKYRKECYKINKENIMEYLEQNRDKIKKIYD